MKKYAILSLMAVLALGACDDDDDPSGPAQTAQVRIVNATSMPTGTANTFATIEAFRGTGTGTRIGTAVAAGAGSACTQTITVPAGTHRINFRTPASQTENAVINSFNFEAGKRYTILFYGTNTSPRSVIIEDETTQGTTTAGNRRIRFINATTNATAADIYARTTSTGAPTAGSATFTNVASGNVGGTGAGRYVLIPTANNIFQIYNTGTTTTARASYTLSTTDFPASGNTTIVFTDNGAYQINACS